MDSPRPKAGERVVNVTVSSTPANAAVATTRVAKNSRAGQRRARRRTSRVTTATIRITKTGPIEAMSPSVLPTVMAAAPVKSTSTGKPMGHLATLERPRAMKTASPISARSAAASARSIKRRTNTQSCLYGKGRGFSPTLSCPSVLMACPACRWASRRDDWSGGRSAVHECSRGLRWRGAPSSPAGRAAWRTY